MWDSKNVTLRQSLLFTLYWKIVSVKLFLPKHRLCLIYISVVLNFWLCHNNAWLRPKGRERNETSANPDFLVRLLGCSAQSKALRLSQQGSGEGQSLRESHQLSSTRGEIKASLFIKTDKFSIFMLSLLQKHESAVLINEADLKNPEIPLQWLSASSRFKLRKL